MDLREAVAVVTGGASGIGRAAALAFAREGADVVVADLNEVGAKEIVGEIEALGRKALAVRTDVGRREDVESLVDEAIAWQGHVDLFFSNAGVAVSGPPHLIPLEDWEWIVDVNLWSHIWAVRKVLPHMLERGSGHLVHTASAAGVMGVPGLAPYNVTKFGVVGLCESLAAYGHDRGVGVSVVCPLFVATNIMSGARNTPEEGVTPQMQERMREFGQRMIASTGIPPEQVADDIVDAVHTGRLYVLPHPEVKEMVAAKWADPDQWVSNVNAFARAQREAFGGLIG